MKRTILVLAVLFIATTAFAGGGAHCDMKAKAKNVELTGTLSCPDGDCEKAVFKVADSEQSYSICHKTKEAIRTLGQNAPVNLKVKGNVANCDGEGEVLVIQSAKKI
jgi:hypothetical protein